MKTIKWTKRHGNRAVDRLTIDSLNTFGPPSSSLPIVPKVQQLLAGDGKKEHAVVLRILTGHCKLKKYLYMKKLSKTLICRGSDQEDKTATHTL